MNHAYDEFGQGSQSPYTLGRGAHPGAVLLSPQSSAMNLSNSIASPMVLSPKIGAQSHSMFFNDVVDAQPLPQPAIPPHSSSTTPAAPATATGMSSAPNQGSQATQNPHATHNSAAGSAVLSPMVQSPNCNPSALGSTSMFLDSFTRPSSTSMLGVHSKPKQQPQHSQHAQVSQQHHSQQLPASQTATTSTPTSQHLPQGQQPPQSHQQTTVPPPPPQVPNNPVVNFTQDINQLCSWMSMLSSAQQNTVMDNLLFTLHEDVLQYTKLKLNSLVKSGFISPQMPAIASPVPNRDPYPLVNLDSVFSSDDIENDPNDNSILFQQWSPQPTSVTQPIFDCIKDVHQRPKSADPHVARATGHAPSNNKPKRNLGVGNNSSNGNNNNNNNNNCNPHSNVHSYGHSSNNHHFTSKARAAAASGGDIDSSGSTESLSRPASRGNVPNGSVANNSVHNNNNSTGNNTHSGSSNNNNNNNNNNNSTSNNATPTGTTATNGSSMNPKTLTDPRLLTNIPVWLKSLRLHKYSDSLRSKRWDELIYLDDETLEKMGISALGARRKLLKAFAVVKEYKEQGLIDQSAYV
ncbi:hypothetical protein ZYGR_0AK02150 [Zygosaccharomyces rouxii]|uniref:RNA-binding protein VTS1 n=1 Tax=Zygosaccharomyces rouxii TaxID=4956 RepID=A0A1Q3AE05_ZYGRO|nr:hypothetical protein ZYGR_0AK02150 [Zygosaccharomyces rouxii]